MTEPSLHYKLRSYCSDLTVCDLTPPSLASYFVSATASWDLLCRHFPPKLNQFDFWKMVPSSSDEEAGFKSDLFTIWRHFLHGSSGFWVVGLSGNIRHSPCPNSGSCNAVRTGAEGGEPGTPCLGVQPAVREPPLTSRPATPARVALQSLCVLNWGSFCAWGCVVEKSSKMDEARFLNFSARKQGFIQNPPISYRYRVLNKRELAWRGSWAPPTPPPPSPQCGPEGSPQSPVPAGLKATEPEGHWCPSP